MGKNCIFIACLAFWHAADPYVTGGNIGLQADSIGTNFAAKLGLPTAGSEF
jgi:hypothetical protein